MFSTMISLVLSWAFGAAQPNAVQPAEEIQNVIEYDLEQVSIREQFITRNYYIDLTGSEEITDAIIDAANKHDIPYSLAFALAMKESSFNPRDLSENATSVDRGLFQLNSISFPHLSNEECFDPRLSADVGLGYLRYCWNRGGNATVALAMYNAGPTRVENQGTPVFTMGYIHKIYAFQDQFEKELQQRLVFNPLISLQESEKTVKNMGSLVEHLEDIN
jgi:soluble lytic murein transglycosylase-like protein